jgi:hypothetical protein
MKGELVRPETDPSVLKTLPTLDSVKIERNVNQNGISAKATIVKATENNIAEIEFGSPFLAITAPKSLK